MSLCAPGIEDAFSSPPPLVWLRIYVCVHATLPTRFSLFSALPVRFLSLFSSFFLSRGTSSRLRQARSGENPPSWEALGENCRCAEPRTHPLCLCVYVRAVFPVGLFPPKEFPIRPVEDACSSGIFPVIYRDCPAAPEGLLGRLELRPPLSGSDARLRARVLLVRVRGRCRPSARTGLAPARSLLRRDVLAHCYYYISRHIYTVFSYALVYTAGSSTLLLP